MSGYIYMCVCVFGLVFSLGLAYLKRIMRSSVYTPPSSRVKWMSTVMDCLISFP